MAENNPLPLTDNANHCLSVLHRLYYDMHSAVLIPPASVGLIVQFLLFRLIPLDWVRPGTSKYPYKVLIEIKTRPLKVMVTLKTILAMNQFVDSSVEYLKFDSNKYTQPRRDGQTAKNILLCHMQLRAQLPPIL